MTDFSFMIPALNEERYLYDCLQSIVDHRPPGQSYEILVGDNGSEDDTTCIVRDFSARFPDIRIDFVPCNGATVAGVRNLLAREATGQYYVFLDADTRLTPEWTTFSSSLFESPRSAFVAGSRVVSPPEDKNNYLWQHWFRHLEGHPAPGSYVNAGHMITHRHVFSFIEGFDPNLATGEDVDFCHRAVQAGYALYIHPELLVYHVGYPKHVKGFFRRELWHGVGDFKDRKSFMKSPPAMAGLTYLVLLCAGLPAMLFNPLLFIPWAGSVILIPVGVSMLREPELSVKERCHHAYLTAVYLLARGMSLLYRNEKQRFVEYR